MTPEQLSEFPPLFVSRKAKVLEIWKNDYHRNGIAGEGFEIALFCDEGRTMVGIVFPTEGHVAILDLELLSQGVIEFGKNSWRGDQYEEPLRKALKELNKEE